MAQSSYEEVGSRVCAKNEIIEERRIVLELLRRIRRDIQRTCNGNEGASSVSLENCLRQFFFQSFRLDYPCRNTKHIHVPLDTANTNAHI